MDEELSNKDRVVILLTMGWPYNIFLMGKLLNIPDEEMEQIIEDLQVDGTINTHTLH